ncbi:adenylate cyclase, aggregation specific-like [Mercenaria mercenaria]|uniref:adenylate cyclase, aggregation specific-like n=1 Tax=Mercenaria mercenaria TaxID=6596 RepID=UPI00234F6229|nr:adenylate cyclase, aggregation specific-like [Mercenaria mercenaria]
MPFQLHPRTATVSPLPVVNQNTFATKILTKEKYKKMFRLLIMTTIPAFIVISQSIINLRQDYELHQANKIVKDGIQQSLTLSKVIHHIQIERGTTALYVSSQGDPFVKKRLITFYGRTDMAIASLSKLTFAANFDSSNVSSKLQLSEYISNFRSDLHPINTTLKEVIEFYTEINADFIAKMADFINIKRPVSFWTELAAYILITSSKEESGIERALGSTYFARGNLPLEDLLWYTEKHVLGIRLLDQGLQFSSNAKTLLFAAVEGTILLDSIMKMRHQIKNNTLSTPSVQLGTLWFDNMTTYINILEFVLDNLAVNIVQNADEDITYLNNKIVADIVQSCIAIVMIPIVVILVSNIVNISNRLKVKTFDLEEEKRQTETLLTELEEERNRTEELLHQLLPKSVAKTLMENGIVDPESFDSVTIMFSDVVGFTKIASSSTPMQVVQMLNKLYKTTDGHLEKVDAYKVETIGDAYMVASGLPKRNGEQHVVEIATLAIGLQAEQILIPHKENEVIQLRIGFNTGPCVAAVVGIRMPRYCIFGDTVNTASRMESSGLPLRIQMTQSSAFKLQQTGRFEISERGEVDIKGKGVMLTYWLEGMQSYDVVTIESGQETQAEQSKVTQDPTASVSDTEFDSSPQGSGVSGTDSPGHHEDCEENIRVVWEGILVNWAAEEDTSERQIVHPSWAPLEAPKPLEPPALNRLEVTIPLEEPGADMSLSSSKPESPLASPMVGEYTALLEGAQSTRPVDSETSIPPSILPALSDSGESETSLNSLEKPRLTLTQEGFQLGGGPGRK